MVQPSVHPLLLAELYLLSSGSFTDAFSFPWWCFSTHPPSNNILGGGCNNGGGRKTRLHRFCDGGDDDANFGINAFKLTSIHWVSVNSDEPNGDDEISREDKVKSKDIFQESNEVNFNPIQTEYHHGGATSEKPNIGDRKSIGASLKPIRFAASELSKHLPANPFQRNVKDQSNKSKLRQHQKELSSTVVRSVSAPGSELLLPDDITQCAKESNLIGGTLTPETLELTAKKINHLYLEHGYVMNCVTGATLVPSSKGKANDREGHVELKVREVRLATPSQRNSSLVHVRFVEKMNREDAGDKENVISLPLQSSSIQSQSDHQAFRIVPGRTRPAKIARMLNLVPGSHFCILPDLWSRLVASPGSVGGGGGGKQQQAPIFSAIHALRPLPAAQDSVELEIVATENKPYASLEYGLTKSLYSDQWEGELDLKHANVLGGGEVATMNIRKGKSCRQKGDSGLKNWKHVLSSGPISWRMSIKDDYLGSSYAGYDIEVFRDSVDINEKGEDHKGDNDEFKGGGVVGTNQPKASGYSNEEDCPLRTGVTMKLRLPQSSHSFALPKFVSARFERVDPFTKNERAQCMTSMSTDFDYKKTWHVSTRPVQSTVSVTGSAGRKWNTGGKPGKADDSSPLPYATGTITSQHITPLSSKRGSIPSIDLAIRHVASASSRHLPRHEAIILGLSSRIRGYKYNHPRSPVKHQQQKTKDDDEKSLLQSLRKLVQGKGKEQFRPPIALSNAISGTIEVRIPFERLVSSSIIRRGDVVLFGDWCVSQAQPPPLHILNSPEDGDLSAESFRHSSLGIGLRKVVQGIPLKVDACLTEHGTKGLFFGIGHN
jgi:hypothetical protein